MNDQINPIIRKALPEDGDAIAHVQIKTWKKAYAGIFPADRLASLESQRKELTERWQSNIRAEDRYPAFFVAEQPKAGVIGFAAADPQPNPDYPFKAELQLIYILPEYHRLGIGTKLMRVVAEELLKTGFTSLMLWVLKDNHDSRKFYETLGGKLVGESEYLRWDKAYAIVAYGWDDLSSLA